MRWSISLRKEFTFNSIIPVNNMLDRLNVSIAQTFIGKVTRPGKFTE